MHPLLVCVTDPFTKTEAGLHNLANLRALADLQTIDMNTNTFCKATRMAFEDTGEALKYLETLIYVGPAKIAAQMGIELVVFGENSSFLYGAATEDTASALGVLATGHSGLGKAGESRTVGYWSKKGLKGAELNPLRLTKPFGHITPVFMSYYIPWDDETNLAVAKQMGFHTLSNEWRRDGYVEDYAQIDSVGYMTFLWLKYPKFGFQRVSDIVSRWVRKGKISRAEGLDIVRENDHKLDQLALDDFCTTLGYSYQHFWDIVEKMWNPDLFEKVGGVWQMKP